MGRRMVPSHRPMRAMAHLTGMGLASMKRFLCTGISRNLISLARRAMEIQLRLMPVHKHLFVEANPIPVKWALARMGLMGGALRLPMTPLSKAQEPVVEAALRAAGLLT